MATITIKQFFRNVFYIMLTLSATPYMLLSTFLSLFMEVPVISLSMEVYVPGYEIMTKYEEESQTEAEEDEEDEHEHEHEDEDEDEDEDEHEDEDEDEHEDEDVEEDKDNQPTDTYPVLTPINIENHDHNTASGHCTPIPRHNSEVCPESPLKRRPTDIEDENGFDTTADFKTIGELAAETADLPTIDDIESHTPPPSVESVRQEPSESFSSEENDE